MILQKFSDAESSIYLQNMINDTNTNLEGLISTSTSPNRANYRQIKKGGNIALAYFHDVKLNAIRRFIAHSSFNDKQYFHLIQNIHGPTYTACFRPSLVNRTNNSRLRFIIVDAISYQQHGKGGTILSPRF
jgi:hypothetical protein